MELGDEQIELTAKRRRFDRGKGVLVGSRCSDCGATSWPSRGFCHVCGAAADLDVELSREGTLLTFSQVWVARPGIEIPYTLGQIELDGASLFAHVRKIDAGAKVPLRVALVIAENENEDEQIAFWFEPSGDYSAPS